MATEDIHHASATLVDHLPVLVVLIPFVAAPLLVLLGSRRLAWPLALAASVGSLIVAALLLARVMDGGIISYHLGGWAPPLGIEYRVDAANAFLLLLITLVATIVLPYAQASIRAEIPEKQHTLFYSLFLLCLTGLLGVVVTGDAFNVFVFLEISSLSTYVLIAMGARRDKRALTAAYDYLIMGTIGATFFVIGIGFLYMATGTLNMADIADRIADQGDSRCIDLGFKTGGACHGSSLDLFACIAQHGAGEHVLGFRMSGYAKAGDINTNDAHTVNLVGEQIQRHARCSRHAEVDYHHCVVFIGVGQFVDRFADILKQLTRHQ